MTMSETINELSVEARTALTSVKNSNVGTVIEPMITPFYVTRELRQKGLTGQSNGLTIRGSAVAMKLQNAQLDALFGPE